MAGQGSKLGLAGPQGGGAAPPGSGRGADEPETQAPPVPPTTGLQPHPPPGAGQLSPAEYAPPGGA